MQTGLRLQVLLHAVHSPVAAVSRVGGGGGGGGLLGLPGLLGRWVAGVARSAGRGNGATPPGAAPLACGFAAVVAEGRSCCISTPFFSRSALLATLYQPLRSAFLCLLGAVCPYRKSPSTRLFLNCMYVRGRDLLSTASSS